jgi:hypothetical protein
MMAQWIRRFSFQNARAELPRRHQPGPVRPDLISDFGF